MLGGPACGRDSYRLFSRRTASSPYAKLDGSQKTYAVAKGAELHGKRAIQAPAAVDRSLGLRVRTQTRCLQVQTLLLSSPKLGETATEENSAYQQILRPGMPHLSVVARVHRT